MTVPSIVCFRSVLLFCTGFEIARVWRRTLSYAYTMTEALPAVAKLGHTCTQYGRQERHRRSEHFWRPYQFNTNIDLVFIGLSNVISPVRNDGVEAVRSQLHRNELWLTVTEAMWWKMPIAAFSEDVVTATGEIVSPQPKYKGI